jgi:hypothetical protein
VAAFERETKSRLESVEAQADQHARDMAEFRVQMVEFRATVARVLDALERFIARRPGADGGRP